MKQNAEFMVNAGPMYVCGPKFVKFCELDLWVKQITE